MVFTIILKLFFGLFGLLLVARLLGKKTLSEITPFDLIYTLVLGGILEESIYDDNVSVFHVLFAIALWALLIYFIEEFVKKNETINRWLKGEPAVLIHNGQLNIQEITRNHIEMEQLRTMLRQQQCFSLANAKYVVLENAGQISVLTHSEDEQTLAIMLVDQGNIQYPVMQSHHLSETWLREELQKHGYSSFKNLIYVEWSQDNGFYIITKAETIQARYRIDG